MATQVHQASYIEASDLVPKEWVNWFWGLISESAPFSWGDNNRTFVTASRFLNHVSNALETVKDFPEEGDPTEEEIDNFLKVIDELGETYIDLEN
jgi:hypothetical protein